MYRAPLLVTYDDHSLKPVQTCSFADPPNWYWHLVATETHTVGKQVVRILLECFLLRGCILASGTSKITQYANTPLVLERSFFYVVSIDIYMVAQPYFENLETPCNIVVTPISYSYDQTRTEYVIDINMMLHSDFTMFLDLKLVVSLFRDNLGSKDYPIPAVKQFFITTWQENEVI